MRYLYAFKFKKDLGKSLKCNFCSNQLHETVTIIPCGHSYCLKCKDGYTGICSKCGPKVKVYMYSLYLRLMPFIEINYWMILE